jgi:farnesyl-diphosphate farnesyltransferase
MSLKDDAKEVLKQTSRTFYPSIVSLPSRIREAVMSSYLSLRAIDEIEDHPQLSKATKTALLSAVSAELRQSYSSAPPRCALIFRPHRDTLPEVTSRLDDWLSLSPRGTAPTVHLATALMSQRMAHWVDNEWLISSKRDLDRYTFSVAGAVGVLLSDLWAWYDGTTSRRSYAISYGRGLQAVNILRNRTEDLGRGVDFFPRGWNSQDFLRYARSNLLRGDAYVNGFPLEGAAHEFCRGPQALAHATLDALERGESKLSRGAVLAILGTRESVAPISPEHEKVVLVNQDDQAIGTEEKLAAHIKGALHRAFSVFIFNSSHQLLLQRRTTTKYHSRGLWSNTCCGHPRPDETIEQASRRRLKEEMGFDSKLTKLFDFVYRAELEDGLIEYEYDHVLFGYFNGTPTPNCNEVAEWQWMDLEALRLDLQNRPESYTYWFRKSLNQFQKAFEPIQFSLETAQLPSHV